MVFPIADDNRTRRTAPWLTYALIAANVAIFVYVAGADPARQAELMDRYAAVPATVLHGGPAAWLTLLTCTFLHASWLHLGGNMLFLWVFGDNVEDALGHVRYLVFYLLCGGIASLAQALLTPSGTIVGSA